MATLTLNIEVDTPGVGGLDTLDGKLRSIEGSASKTGSVTQGIFQGIGQSVATAGIGLVKAGIDVAINKVGESLELASTKAEAASKVNNLFGESAGIVTEASKGAAEAVGLSSGAYLVQAGNIGNLITNLGFAGDEAANMSVDMLSLAADMGSFNDASTEEVTEAMGAAFRGETEPIRRFGVMLDDASVKAKAVELGLYSGVGALDKNAKATATYQLILEQTTKAQGDFAETSDGLANSQKIASAQMDEAWTRVGEALTPIAATIMPLLADAVVWVADAIAMVIEWVMAWVNDNQALIAQIQTIASLIGDTLLWAFDAVVGILGDLAYSIGGIIGLFIDLGGAIIDAGAAILKLLQGDFAGAAASAQMALDRVGSFAENVQRAMLDTGRRAADEALAAASVTETAAADSAAGATDALAGGYRAGTPAVDEAAARVGDLLPTNLQEGADEAEKIANQTPGEIADGLRKGRDAVGSAMDQLKEDMKKAISPAKEMANLEGMLSGKALARGLASQDPIVRAQAEATTNTIEARLAELKGIGTDAGALGAGAIPGGMRSEAGAVEAAATGTTEIVANQLSTMQNGAKLAATVATNTLVYYLKIGAPTVARAGGDVGAAYIAGLVSGINSGRDDVARAAAYATAPIRGHSPPRVGPLRHIDDDGAAVAEAWWEGMARSLHRRIETPAFATPGPLGLTATPGAWPAATGHPGGSGAVFNVTVQAGVGDPVAIGREVVDAITAFERSGGRSWRES